MHERDERREEMEVRVNCRHRQTWIMGSSYEWCYQCGAFRRMRQTAQRNVIAPDSAWVTPTGPGGVNPVNLWERRNATWTKRRDRREDGVDAQQRI